MQHIRISQYDNVISTSDQNMDCIDIHEDESIISTVPNTDGETVNIIVTHTDDVKEIKLIGKIKFIHFNSKSKIRINLIDAEVEILSTICNHEIISPEHIEYYIIDNHIREKEIILIGMNMIDMQNMKKIYLDSMLSNGATLYKVDKIKQEDVSMIEKYVEDYL